MQHLEVDEAIFDQHGHYDIQDTVSLKEEGILDKDYHAFWGV